jgi:hypothetical protein
MEQLYGFPKWAVAVIEHWHGWLSGGVLAFVLEIGDKLWDWKVSKRTFAIILGVGFLWSVFAAWRDEHRNTEQVIEGKAEAWSKYNACDTERRVDDALAKQLSGQVGAQQMQLANQQDTFNRCVLALGQISIPQPLRVRTTITEISSNRLSVVTPNRQSEKLLLVLATVNKPVSPVKGVLECDSAVSFDTATISGRAPFVSLSKSVISDRKFEFGFNNPVWTEDRPLVFTLVTQGSISPKCDFKLE